MPTLYLQHLPQSESRTPSMNPLKSMNPMKNSMKSPALSTILAAGILGLAAQQASAATVTITEHTGTVKVVDTGLLTIGPVDDLNITNNAVVVRTTPFTTVNGYTTSGFAGGLWNGFGINSSIAAAGAFPTAVANIDNSILSAATFFGISVGADDSLVRFTYYGDANGDGLVDGTDYAFTDAGFGPGTTWVLGDFNYDGATDGTDYAFIDAGFGGQGAPLGASFAGDGGGGAGAVPEPGSIGLLLVGALGLLNRRRP